MNAMGPVAKGLRLWHTVRHLKPVQVYGRVLFRLRRPAPDLSPAPPLRPASGPWAVPAAREPSLDSATRMRFLGESHDLDAVGWDDPGLAKLWRYNQHYFDDLNAIGAEERAAWHRTLLERWIAECPPARGTAWEPYPISLRVVNWLKWLEAGHAPVDGMLESLAVQVRHLSRRLEWHLLGNHLFVNAKALVMAGCFFDGPEADRWRETGLRILRAQIPEQILADGGQFERSPMYHALAVEDMLDLLNAMGRRPGVVAAEDLRRISEPVAAMRRFLAAVCHPDGEVSFFNDSAMGVAPTAERLESYARGLGLPVPPVIGGGAVVLQPSGFARLERGGAVLLADVGPIGPDYLPGHAHADTLSFELSIGGHRLLVNSGTSQYGVGEERLRQRGTAAHNALTVGGADSSEVWGGFRVARRARVGSVRLDDSGDPQGPVRLGASHDGFRRLRGGGDHRRTWCLAGAGSDGRSGTLEVRDEVAARGKIESFWHFEPSWTVSAGPDERTIAARGNGFTLEMTAVGGAWRVGRSTYHPRFGSTLPNVRAVVRFGGPVSTVRISWSPCTSSS